MTEVPRVICISKKIAAHTLHNYCCNDDNDNNDMLVEHIFRNGISLKCIIRKTDRVDAFIYKIRSGEMDCLFSNLAGGF